MQTQIKTYFFYGPSKQFANQSGCETLSSDNDLWKVENGVFFYEKKPPKIKSIEKSTFLSFHS